MAMVDSNWLPEGEHWGLVIEHHELPNVGAFTGGSNKGLIHTTESPANAYESMKQLFIDRVAEGILNHPHIVYGQKGKKLCVCQFVPFNRASAALQHPSGTPETNRAKCIQTEVCGIAAHSGDWNERYYKGLGNLYTLVSHRRPIAQHIPIPFSSNKRFTSGAFISARGYCGHKHAPHNTHTDPGITFKGGLFLECLKNAPNKTN